MFLLRSKLTFGFGGIVLLIGIFNGCVTEQQFFALDERVAALEQNNAEQKNRLAQLVKEIDQIESQQGMMSETGNQKTRNLRDRLAKSSIAVDQLRAELQKLRGTIEETQYLARQQQKVLERSEGERLTKLDDVEKMSKQTRNRVSRIEQYLNLVEAAKKPAAKTPPVPAPKAIESTSETGGYNLAKQTFDRGEYEAAREKFEGFLKTYPKSNNADNAQFWIGETYYREKWYEKAILEYQKVIDDYPKGNKVQAALLKQGLSFLNLGDRANSRLILKELVSKYPNSNEATVAKRKLTEIR
jgi:tol-pal system protein YbgF